MIALVNKKSTTKDRVLAIIPPPPQNHSHQSPRVAVIKTRMMNISIFIFLLKQQLSGHNLILERMLGDNPSQVPNKENILIGGNF